MIKKTEEIIHRGIPISYSYNATKEEERSVNDYTGQDLLDTIAEISKTYNISPKDIFLSYSEGYGYTELYLYYYLPLDPKIIEKNKEYAKLTAIECFDKQLEQAHKLIDSLTKVIK